MRLGTVISIGASAVLGVGALLIARLWIPTHAPHPAAAQAAVVAQPVPVVVAALPIPWGAKLEPRYLKVANLPAGAVPQGAYSNIGQILNQDGGAPIALAAMATQEPVLPSKLTGPGERQTLAALVDPDMRAYTIAVNAATAGGGHILPGDRVDVLYTRELPLPPATKESWNYKLVGATVLIQSVRVLGMDLNANPTSTQPAVASTATLEVGMQDAEKLALATQGGGTLSLALRRPGSSAIEPLKRFMIDDPRRDVGYGSPAAAAPRTRAPGGPHSRSTQMADAGSSVTIVNGEVSNAVTVPHEAARAGF